MNKYKRTGWYGDNYRHSLAARGYRTNLAVVRGDNFIMSDQRVNWDSDKYMNKARAVAKKELMEESYPGMVIGIGKKSSHGNYDEYLKNQEMQDLNIMESDIRDAEEALADMRARKEHLKLLEEMEKEKDSWDDTSVQGRGAFAALDVQPSEVDAPPLKNFLSEAIQESLDYMTRPNEGISVDNPLKSSIKESWNNWMKPKREILVGGLGDNKPDTAFDQAELQKGVKVELEHTKNPEVAKEISKDHLSEDPKYYDKLEKMESGYYNG